MDPYRNPLFSAVPGYNDAGEARSSLGALPHPRCTPSPLYKLSLPCLTLERVGVRIENEAHGSRKCRKGDRLKK